MAKLKEFIQIEGLNEIQEEIRELNYKLLNAMNQTNVVRELFLEKNQVINQARNVSAMLIPEVRELNSFLGGEMLGDETPAPRKRAPRTPKRVTKRRPGRPKKVTRAAPRIPKQLNDILPRELQQKPKKKRGRPRKAKPEVEVAERINPLEELRRNLAQLRQ